MAWALGLRFQIIPLESIAERRMERRMACKVGAVAGTSGGLFGMVLIGTAIYFFSGAPFSQVGLGFLKALVRPIGLVYDFLKHHGVQGQ